MIAMGLLGHKVQEGKVKATGLHVCPVSVSELLAQCRMTGAWRRRRAKPGRSVVGCTAGTETLGAQVLQLGK